MSIKPCLRWVGSKQASAGLIAGLIDPQCTAYTEPYFGSGAVFLARRRVALEIVNDIDGQLVLFYRTLREHTDDLLRAVALTPCAEDEFRAAVDDPGLDDVERSRRFFVRTTLRHGGSAGGGWAPTYKPTGWSNSLGERWIRSLDRLAPVAERLRGVQIINTDALELLDRITEHPEYAVYLDPPYLESTRNGSSYGHDVDDEHHRRMLDIATSAQAQVVISGYQDQMYDEALAGWKRIEVGSYTFGASGGGKRQQRTEVIWTNRSEATLFD